MQICLGDESRDRTAFALMMRSSGIAIFCTILSEKSATYQNPDLTLKHFEIRHDVHYLTRRKLKPRHRRMNSLKQRSLQICNWISEAQCAKWGRIRKATPADFTDGVTLRAILAGEYQTSPFRWRLLCESGFSYTQQECAPGKNVPSGLDRPSLYHSCALPARKAVSCTPAMI
jgi:hypothetical protein